MVSAGRNLRRCCQEPDCHCRDQTQAHTRGMVAVGKEILARSEAGVWSKIQVRACGVCKMVRRDGAISRGYFP